MIFGVSPTKDAVVIAQTTGSGETFVIKSIKSIQFQTQSGDDLTELLKRLVVLFGRGGKYLFRSTEKLDRLTAGNIDPSCDGAFAANADGHAR